MFDLEDFKYNFVNMTAFRVVDAGELSVQEVLRDMARFQPGPNGPSFNSTYIQVSSLSAKKLLSCPHIKSKFYFYSRNHLCIPAELWE